MGLPTILYNQVAGKTKVTMEWLFILWQLWSSAQCSLLSSLFYAPSTERP